ncbi:MAG: DUF4386 domain-containing protein, partial [Bacteroidetes bacterium]|nr:DUF4386 domain-containing protein [Bacteroidota bacterium]
KDTARIAGLLYLLQIPIGVFGIMYIPKILVVPGNVSVTISNILANEFLFRLSIVCAILCALITVFTAVFISKLLKPINESWAKAIILLTALVAPISMVNELFNVAVLLLAKDSSVVSGYSENQVHSLLFLFLELHKYGMQIIGIFFGLWLLPMGYLVIKSNIIPKTIGILLLVTCCGYLIDFTTFFLIPGIKVVVSEYAWLGEVLMVLWLLIKGDKLKIKSS